MSSVITALPEQRKSTPLHNQDWQHLQNMTHNSAPFIPNEKSRLTQLGEICDTWSDQVQVWHFLGALQPHTPWGGICDSSVGSRTGYFAFFFVEFEVSARAHRYLPRLYSWIYSILGKKWEVFRGNSFCFTERSLLNLTPLLAYIKAAGISHENLNAIKNNNSPHFDLLNHFFFFLSCSLQQKESKDTSLLASSDLWNYLSTKQHICCISIMVIREKCVCLFFFFHSRLNL